MAIQKKVDGVYKDVADVLTPIMDGARKSFKAVRKKVDGAWQDIWTALKNVALSYTDDYHSEPYEMRVTLEDNNITVTHMLSYQYDNGYGTLVDCISTIMLECLDISETSYNVSFDISVVTTFEGLDVGCEVQILEKNENGYYGITSTTNPLSSSDEYCGEPISEYPLYRHKKVSVNYSNEFSGVHDLAIKIVTYGTSWEEDGDYYSTEGDIISVKISNILINGEKWGGSLMYSNSTSYYSEAYDAMESCHQ